jgi:hypothetical protein
MWFRQVTALVMSAAVASADPLAPASTPEDTKSPYLALGLSGGTTLGGIALLEYDHWKHESNPSYPLIAAGLIAIAVGPTTGHVYAGDSWNTGLKLRLVSVGGGVLSLPFFIECIDGESREHAACDIGGAIAVASALLYGGATLYEIGMAGAAASRHDHAHAAAPSVMLVPLRTRDSTIPALAIGGRF